ncbi:MAG: histidine kinase [Candidatus Dormibacteraeota bacterium]|nr:histidine kinase [Candidatus Dormibacteraeota bacterium]
MAPAMIGGAVAQLRVNHLRLRPGVRHLGWTLAAVAAVIVVASRLLLALDPYVRLRHPGPPVWMSVTGDVAGPVFGVVTISVIGAVVITREPASRLGWALLGTALAAALTLLCEEYAIQGLVAAPGSLPLAEPAAWTQRWSFDLLLLGLVLGLLLFPDGRLSGRGARLTVWLAVAATVLAIANSFADPALLQTSVRDEGYPLPVTMPTALWRPSSMVAQWLGRPGFWAQMLLLPLASVGLLLRLRGAGGEQQRQIKWVAYAGAFVAIGWLVSYIDELPSFLHNEIPAEPLEEWSDLLWTFGVTVAVPVAAAFAVLRYRLYEIDRVVNRTVLVGGLAVFITGVYVTVVVGVGSAVGGFGPLLSLVAAAIAAVGFAPVRSRLQLLANRLVYGPRATPYEVLTDFAERLGEYADPGVLPMMARLVAEGLGANRAQVWLRVGPTLRLAAAWPPETGGQTALPISGEELPGRLSGGRVLSVRDQNQLLGALEISKDAGDRLTRHESRLLEDLARQAALILRTLRLIEELRTSRERIVSAHDDERRRLERDLHDGAQQRLLTSLVGLSMVESDMDAGRSEAARRSLADASQQLSQGLAELRDLARGIHPAIVTDSGLAAAIESLVELSHLTVALDVHVPGRLPAAVETTAYFLISEALANVAKHAAAPSARVCARVVGTCLLIEVADDGVGGADPARGSGLRGLEDRLAALGGTLRIKSPSLGGTRLEARLPCE